MTRTSHLAFRFLAGFVALLAFSGVSRAELATISINCQTTLNDPLWGSYIIPRGNWDLQAQGMEQVVLVSIKVTLYVWDPALQAWLKYDPSDPRTASITYSPNPKTWAAAQYNWLPPIEPQLMPVRSGRTSGVAS